MKTKFLKLVTVLLCLTAAGTASAQQSIVRIPLIPFGKPALDLAGPNGDNISIGELKTKFDHGIDLSTIDPVENKFWQNRADDNEVRKEKYSALDQMLHMQMPNPETGLIYDGFVGVVRELRMYAINVRSANNPNDVYRLKSGAHVHSSLVKAALLRKMGIFQESPKYYNSVNVQFKSLEDMKDFIKKAFCVSGPGKASINCLDMDPQARGFITAVDEQKFRLKLHGSYLEKLNPEVPNLFDGITPANEKTLPLYAQSRAYKALIVPYMVAAVGESINRFSPQAVSVRGGWAHLSHAFAMDFNNVTTYDDVRWALRNMLKLTDADWNEIVAAGSFPVQIAPVVKAKLIHRFNDFLKVFMPAEGRKAESRKVISEASPLLPVPLPDLEYTSGDGVVVKGKVISQEIAGYPQRFSHGERQSPFESGDFLKFMKIKAQSTVIDTALNKFSGELQKMGTLSQEIVGVEVGPNGVRPLVNAHYYSLGLNASANRIVTTGTYYGSQAAVQLVDSLTLSASAGYFHVLDGLNGIDTVLGGGVSYIRNFIHVTPIAKMEEASKTPLKNMFIPSALRKLTSPLKDGDLSEFLTSLKTGEVFTITDSIGLSGQIGVNTAIDALIGFATYGATVGFSVDGNKIILRQIQFLRTADGLQIFVRNQNNAAFGLEFNVNYFINLFKLRYQTTKKDIKTKVYIVNYNAALLSNVDKNDVKPDSDLSKKVDDARTFGSKAALAIRSLIRESNTEAADANLEFQRFGVEHELKAHEIRAKLLWFRASRINEEHELRIKKFSVPAEIHGVPVTNDEVRVVTYKKGRLKGTDYFGFGLDLVDGLLKKRLGGNAPSSLSTDTANPSQVPFGKAEWTVVRADTELSNTRQGALPQVAVIEQIWGGWSLKRREMLNIIEKVKEKTKGIKAMSVAKVLDNNNTYQNNQMTLEEFPLMPTGALAHVDKIDFYRITSHLSILPEGIAELKKLMLSSDEPQTPVEKAKFLGRVFQKLSAKLGDKPNSNDKTLYNNLIKIIGNGDMAAGEQIYKQQCLEQAQKRRGSGEMSSVDEYTYVWKNGQGYECLTDWVDKLISLSRKFPADDLRRQNKWLTEVIYVLEEYVPLSATLNFLGPQKYIYYLEVTGFRTGDEDGDDGSYVSNVFGEPHKRHPYSNGLISVYAEKSKISMTELDQTAGAY